MYTIGEFSKIGIVSTKTLRYYDEIGLLHPASVDEENHYRYYSDEQVDDILFITELKSLDLRLEAIKAVIDNRSDTSLLKHFLNQRILQIDNQMQESIRLRECIYKKMHEIQSGGLTMEQKLLVEAKKFEPALVMSKTATIEISQIGAVIGSVFEEIFKNGLRPAGSVMTFYLDEEFQHEHANIEVCVPIEADKPTDGIAGVKCLEPGECATCTYIGEYSKLGKAYAAVLKWIEEYQYHISSSPFDVYINDPNDIKDPSELITQVWFPISK